MVPRLATEGASFKGAFLYYCHDKNAASTARVAWTETVNLMTDCAEKAWKVMAYTAKVASQLKRAAGKKRANDRIEKPVISYSLSWHPEQSPDKATMLAAARNSIKALKLEEHEAVIVAHNDEPQPHVHIVVNRIHPLTGMAANLYYSKRKLQDWARKFQREEGTDYCPNREENHQIRRKKKMTTRYGTPAIIDAWDKSQCGQSFKEALAKSGYDLAKGRKRLVVVDPYGKTLNPVRQLPDVRAEEFNARIDGIDRQSLRTPEAIIKARSQEKQKKDDSPTHEEPSPKEPDSTKGQPAGSSAEETILEAITRASERHTQEWERFEKQSRERVSTRKAELKKHYKLMERKDTIANLTRDLNAPSLVPKFARRLFGMDKKTEARLGDLQTQQAEAIKRVKSTLKKVQTREDRSLQVLENRHAREMQTLSRRLDALQSREREQPERDRSNRDSRDTSWGSDGPSLSR